MTYTQRATVSKARAGFHGKQHRELEHAEGIRAKMMAPPINETPAPGDSLGWDGGYRYDSVIETAIKYMPEAIPMNEHEDEVEVHTQRTNDPSGAAPHNPPPVRLVLPRTESFPCVVCLL